MVHEPSQTVAEWVLVHEYYPRRSKTHVLRVVLLK